MTTVCVQSRNEDREALHAAGDSAARRALKNALRAEHRDIHYKSITIEKDPRGKPYGRCRGDKALMAISISHSSPFAFAIASTTNDQALGADIERIRDFAPSTWEAFLTPCEKKIIATVLPEEQARLRTISWSFKESVLKAFGVGLRIHPNQVDVSCLILKDRNSSIVTIKNSPIFVEARLWNISDAFIATSIAFPYSPRMMSLVTHHGTA